ncbi:hypothetical protein LZ32DRAFT_48123 [Colletotrichum eremochloae]|nr:hypothetical protein LZ32DRAFT_48123 [Colletotrichum eremochloae]
MYPHAHYTPSLPSHSAHPFLARVASVSPASRALGDRRTWVISSVLPDRSRPIGSGQAIEAATRAFLRRPTYADLRERAGGQTGGKTRIGRGAESRTELKQGGACVRSLRRCSSPSIPHAQDGLAVRWTRRRGRQDVVSCIHVSGLSDSTLVEL